MAKSFTKTVFKEGKAVAEVTIDKEWYENAYGKHERKEGSEYTKPPEDMWYYEAWIEVLKWVGNNSILDIGCGPGQFAKLCIDTGVDYSGIDYSKTAIRMAAKFTGMPELFRCADITSFKSIDPKGSVIVMLEVLEHIVEDLEVIEKISKGSEIIFSVPNYNYRSHYRYFTSLKKVRDRYKHLIDINSSHTIYLNKPKTKAIYLIKSIKK